MMGLEDVRINLVFVNIGNFVSFQSLCSVSHAFFVFLMAIFHLVIVCINVTNRTAIFDTFAIAENKINVCQWRQCVFQNLL